MTKPTLASPKTATAHRRLSVVGQMLIMLFAMMKRTRSFRVFVLWLSAYLVLLSFYFTAILENYNYLEIFPSEMVFPLLMHAVTALLIAAAVCWLRPLKLYFAKLISAIAFALLLVDYDSKLLSVTGLIRAFVPGMSSSDPLAYASIVYLALLVTVVLVIGLLSQRTVENLAKVQAKDVQLGMVILVGFLFLTPFMSLLDILPSMIRQGRAMPPEISVPTGGKITNKPDIYYIVLDRYTNASVLRDQFDYDNTPFTGYLRDKGFRVNDDAYSNYPYTAISMSSTLNAGYIDKLVAPYKKSEAQSRTLFHNSIWQSPVVKALKRAGYSYHVLGSEYGVSYKAPLADREHIRMDSLTIFNTTKKLRGSEGLEFQKGPYYRFAQIPQLSWWPVSSITVDNLDVTRQQLTSLEMITSDGSSGGRFIFAHILVPHDPFAFNADGSLSSNPSSDSVGKPIKQKYVGQVEFINDQMEKAVDGIMKQSKGEAVIMINADEGVYPWVMNGDFKQASPETLVLGEGPDGKDMRQWSEEWLRMKFGILQAAYIPNASDDDMSHVSSVNLFRIVLNKYLGYDLPYLPDCQYGVTNGTQDLFNFADITGRFKDNADRSCQKYQSLSLD